MVPFLGSAIMRAQASLFPSTDLSPSMKTAINKGSAKGEPSFPRQPSALFRCNIDYNYKLIKVAPIAQLDRALVFGTSGWEFEPLWAHFAFNLPPTFTSEPTTLFGSYSSMAIRT